MFFIPSLHEFFMFFMPRLCDLVSIFSVECERKFFHLILVNSSVFSVGAGADEHELATPVLSLCHGIFTDCLFFCERNAVPVQ